MTRLIVAAVLAVAVPVSAAELSTLAAAAVQGPLLALVDSFRQQAGHTVTVTFDTVPNIGRRLAAGERSDILIATAAGIDQAVKDGRVIVDTRLTIGRIGIGVAVSRGGRRADATSADTLKASIAQADAVLISQGTSGTYVQQMFADLGIAEQIKGKVVQLSSGVAVMDRLGMPGRNEIGFTMVSEIKHGEAHGGGTFIAPLPAAFQTFTEYQAIVMTGAREPNVARQFVRTLGSPAAKRLLVENGWEVQDIRTQLGTGATVR